MTKTFKTEGRKPCVVIVMRHAFPPQAQRSSSETRIKRSTPKAKRSLCPAPRTAQPTTRTPQRATRNLQSYSEPFNQTHHFRNRGLHARQDSPGYDTVSDAEFFDLRDALKGFNRFIAKSVAGFDAQFKLVGEFNGIDNIKESLMPFLGSFSVAVGSRYGLQSGLHCSCGPV